MHPQQMSLTFEPGLAQRNRCLRDHLTTRIYGPRYGGLVAVAGKLDMAPSKLSEKLTGCDSGGKVRGLTIDEFAGMIVPFTWGILSQHIFIGIVVAFGAWFALRKAKAGRASSWLTHAAYWYLPAGFLGLRATPPSHCRLLAG